MRKIFPFLERQKFGNVARAALSLFHFFSTGDAGRAALIFSTERAEFPQGFLQMFAFEKSQELFANASER